MKHIAFLVLVAALMLPASITHAQDDELVVYSARKEHLIKPLLEAYTAKTGVQVKYFTGKAGALLERLKAEGANTPADLLVTVDAGNLWHAAEAGLLTRVDSPVLAKNVPSHLRDPESRWFGLSVRARTIVYNTDKVNPSDIRTYENLGSEKFKGRLVLRTSKKVYNQSLVASLIAEHGAEKAQQIVNSWVGNLAADPFSNDTKTMKAIVAGVGDLGVVNTYYYGRLLKKNPDLPLALYWPNQQSGGVHMNVSGAGVVKHSAKQAEAVKLIEWLSSTEAQGLFASLNMEYPANPAVKPDAAVSAWGKFKGSPLNVAVYGEKQADAIRIMDKAGYK